MRARYAVVIAALLSCSTPRNPEAPRALSRVVPSKLSDSWKYHKVEATVGITDMVVCDEAEAAEVARAMLARGGNAVDAAVALAFSLAVTYPQAGNLGGGGFMVARVDGKNHALDFRETAPIEATSDKFVGADGKPNGASRSGHRAAGVPGSVAGLWEAHARLGSGRLTWQELLLPAIRKARDGVVVSAELASTLREFQGRLSANPASAKLFYPAGAPLQKGAVFRNPDLARVLERVSKDGPAGFYQGETADLLVAEMKRNGGFIGHEDLRSYEAKWRPTVEFSYRGHTLVTMPPPSSGGVTLRMALGILEGFDLRGAGFQSPRHLHLSIEAMRRAFAARNARLGDPDFVKNPLEELASPAWIESQRKSISLDRATPSAEVSVGAIPNEGHHTTHFAVVDRKGNAVGLTTTINWWFGAGVTVEGAGFLLNNEMDDFAAVPGTPNSYGLVQGEPNAIVPKKRMLSSMTPTVVLGPSGDVRLVTGAAGGPMIISTVMNIVTSVVDFGLDPASATFAPRIHQQHLPDVVTFEKGGLLPSTRVALEAMGHTFKERNHIADAPTLGRFANGWYGVREPRRMGSVALGN